MSSHARRTWVVSLGLVGLLSQGAWTQQPGDTTSSLPDGTPLQGEQFPRFLTPTYDLEFGFDDFLVLGDHSVIQFELRDLDQESGFSIETWSRTATREVAGRLVSVFRPVWPADRLRDALRTQRWGVDRPSLLWGEVVVPDVGPHGRRRVYLQIAPSNIPPSVVSQASSTLQYTSHAVNIWVPGFGQTRIRQGEGSYDLGTVTKRFYELFVDEYETLAIVSQTALLMSSGGFRRNVKNDVSGIGLELFDLTADYGSSGILQGVEVYPPGGWATARDTLHQQGHQWSDYTGLWDQLGIVREGNEPASHTPLLSPGAVVGGAVLEATRRVDGSSTIDRTLPAVAFHPLTLYRMGLIGLAEVPQLRVFVDQGQFDPADRVSPPIGTRVEGGDVTVVGSDFVAADGARSGPAATRVRRALIYVSRTGLASKAEMDIVNFYAARLAATDGVASWDGYPSFFEATGGRATLTTDVTPRADATSDGKLTPGPTTAHLAVATDALADVILDQPIPGRISAGQAVTLSGTVTSTDNDDSSIACFRFIRYGSTDPNEVFVCGSLTAQRFVVDVTFTADQRGRYTLEPFLFTADAVRPSARSRYGVIEVE